MIDPYLDESGVLKNLRGITDQEELDRVESNLVAVRSVLLQRNPISGNFDTPHLKEIHRYLFRDIYPFAGQMRTISLHKASEFGGARKVTTFTAPEKIEHELSSLFAQLEQDDFLRGLQRRDFAIRAARLFAAINSIHPFREGNGRAQRQFVRQLSTSLGYPLQWDVISKERLVQASISACNGDITVMERLFDEITDTERIQPVAKLIRFFDREKFNWNDRYLATVTPGRRYNGVFVGSDGTNFFFYDIDQRILIAANRDLQVLPKDGADISFVAS